MRCPAAVIVAACYTGAFGQISPAEQRIQNALQTLNSSTTLFMQLKGDEMFGKTDTSLNYVAYFQLSQIGTRVLAQVNITSFSDTEPIMSITGDGVTLWRYDYMNHRYSATVYGTYSGEQPPDYSLTFMKDLSAVADGYFAYPATLLRQVYGASGASYQSWMPGISPPIDGLGNVTYSMGQPPRRTIIFGVGTGALDFISYDDVSTVGDMRKSVDWSMTVLSNLVINPNEFSFVPPPGSRAIAGPHISGSTPVATGRH